MRSTSKSIFAAISLAFSGLAAAAAPMDDVVPETLLSDAMAARELHQEHVSKTDFMVVIDYRQHSAVERYYLVDLRDSTAEAFLVAHGRGSDEDHDGYADTFSNTPDSKMTSLGAFVTGDQYTGRHGISLKLHGLEPQNDKAEERYIVIHGAKYVSPSRNKMGRSWGCPALEQDVAKDMIPRIKGGSFVYIIGQSDADTG